MFGDATDELDSDTPFCFRRDPPFHPGNAADRFHRIAARQVHLHEQAAAGLERLGRAQRLLRVSADTAATTQERERAYRLAQRELDGLVVLPERARVALERGISGELGA